MPSSFGSRLEAAFTQHGQLCVGIDPHAGLLADWALADDATGVEDFALRVIEAAAGRVGIVKPQVAFFERHGSAGFAALERIAGVARDAGLLVIMDAKRGDIGSTMDGYFDAWLGKAAPFYSDALTVSPYLGIDSLSTVMGNAAERGKGLFVLSATSNPEGERHQLAERSGKTVASDIWQALAKPNAVAAGPGDKLGSFGAVLGATIDLKRFGLDLESAEAPLTPILAPGFGAQGARLGELKILFGAHSTAVLASVSRSVLEGGPLAVAALIDAAKAELASGLE